MTKISTLYHATPNTEIEEFEPRNEKIRDPSEGPVVFATPDKPYASCFLVPSDDSWVKICRFSTPEIVGSWKVIVSDEKRFRESDKGGAIYHLPSETFVFDQSSNMGEVEWTSHKAVIPVHTELFDSGIDAMQAFGVAVYFTDRETFAAIKSSADHGKAIIDTLVPYERRITY